MVQSLLNMEFTYERTKRNIETSQPVFPRGDTIDIFGNIYGKDLTGLSAKLTAYLILPDGTESGPFIQLTSEADGGIVIVVSNNTIATFRASIGEDSTKDLEPGRQIVYDIEARTTTTPPIVRTVKGRFSVEMDYTAAPSPSPSPTP